MDLTTNRPRTNTIPIEFLILTTALKSKWFPVTNWVTIVQRNEVTLLRSHSYLMVRVNSTGTWRSNNGQLDTCTFQSIFPVALVPKSSFPIPPPAHAKNLAHFLYSPFCFTPHISSETIFSGPHIHPNGPSRNFSTQKSFFSKRNLGPRCQDHHFFAMLHE